MRPEPGNKAATFPQAGIVGSPNNGNIQDPFPQCMEVWGGSEKTDCSLITQGLDIWLHSQAHEQAEKGGDLYYISNCATGRITRLLLADISGHGVDAAGKADTLKFLMRKHINQLDQSRFARAINRAFTAMSSEGAFASAIMATYFAPTRTLALTNAGHPSPLHYDISTGQWREISESTPIEKNHSDIPLGIISGTHYSVHVMQLEAGDMVCCFTDGISESRDAYGELLGCKGLLQIMNSIESPSGQYIHALLQALEKMNPENLQKDDATLLLFSPNALFALNHKTPGFRGFFQLIARMGKLLVTGSGPMSWPDLHPANVGGFFFSKMNRLWRAKK